MASTAQWTKHFSDMAAGKVGPSQTYLLGYTFRSPMDQLGGGSGGSVVSIVNTAKRGIKRKRTAVPNTSRKRQRTVKTSKTAAPARRGRKPVKKPKRASQKPGKKRASKKKRVQAKKGKKHTDVFF